MENINTSGANPYIPRKNELPEIYTLTAGWAKRHGRTFAEMNRKLGKTHTFLRKALLNRDVRPSILIALSRLLSVNLFEYYIALLPEALRPTMREKELLRQLDELKNELKRVGEERDRYWEKIGK